MSRASALLHRWAFGDSVLPGTTSPRGSPDVRANARRAPALDPDFVYSTALFALALAPRLFAALAFAREPVWDGHYYHFGATRIAGGFGYSEPVTIAGQVVDKPWTHYPVGFSGLLSLVYRVFGSGIATGPIFGAVVGALLVVVTHRVARYMLGTERARLAGAFVLVHPGLILYSAVLMNEQITALLLLCVVWSLVALPGPLGAVGSGLALGLGTLVRPTSLLAVLGTLVLGDRSPLKVLARAAVVTAVGLACVMPWTIRNCRVMDGCALVSTNGGWNLAIGAITTTGRFETLRATDGCKVVTGQVQQDRCWAELGAERIAMNPAAWLRKIPSKLAQTFDHESFPVEYLREAAPDLWPEGRRAAGRELLTLFHRLLMTLAALSPIALVMSPRRLDAALSQGVLLLATVALSAYCFASDQHPFFGLMVLVPFVAALPFPGRPTPTPVGQYLYMTLATTCLTHAVFFGEDRYHLVVAPVLCILAAAALRRSPGAESHA